MRQPGKSAKGQGGEVDICWPCGKWKEALSVSMYSTLRAGIFKPPIRPAAYPLAMG